jgi:hypothetical protein
MRSPHCGQERVAIVVAALSWFAGLDSPAMLPKILGTGSDPLRENYEFA